MFLKKNRENISGWPRQELSILLRFSNLRGNVNPYDFSQFRYSRQNASPYPFHLSLIRTDSFTIIKRGPFRGPLSQLVKNLSTVSLLKSLKDLIDSEARGLGTRRILLEGLDELRDLALNRYQRPSVVNQPVIVVI
jgi:hypothetical protein